MFRRKNPFRKLTRKEIHRYFPKYMGGYIDQVYELFYWTLVTFLATADEPELHVKLIEEFTHFLEEADRISNEYAEDKDKQAAPNLNTASAAELFKWLSEQQQNPN